MNQRPGCSLCLHACDERWVGDGVRAFCSTCLGAIGRFATSGSARIRFWPALEGVARELVERTPDMFRDLRAVLERETSSPPVEAETHLDLSVAYREMGLVGDALWEAASALQDERHLTRPRALEALTILIDRRHLVVAVDELMSVLRERLFVH